MDSHLSREAVFVKFLLETAPTQQIAILSTVTDNQVRALSEIAYNLPKLEHLGPHQRFINYLGDQEIHRQETRHTATESFKYSQGQIIGLGSMKHTKKIVVSVSKQKVKPTIYTSPDIPAKSTPMKSTPVNTSPGKRTTTKITRKFCENKIIMENTMDKLVMYLSSADSQNVHPGNYIPEI